MRVVSTHLFCNRRLHTALLDRLVGAGAEAIELFCARQSFDYREPVQVESVANWFRQSGTRLHAVHAPMYTDAQWGRGGEPPVDIAHADHRRRLAAIEEVRRALDLADTMPFRYLVQHLGVGGTELDERRVEAGFSSLERLRLLAKRAGVTILLENIPNGLSTPDQLAIFLDRTHLDDVGVCFDAGHAHLPAAQFGGGGALAAFERLRPRLRSTHLHDNRGRSDDHLWPGEGTLAWAELMPRLAALPELPWVLELADHPPDDVAFARLGETWSRLAAWAAA